MNKGFAQVLIILVALVVTGVVGVGLYLNKSKTIQNINSFEECIKAGFPVMESYPRQCKTSDGKSFTEPLSDSEKFKLIPPKVEVTPESSNSAETEDWKTYTNQKYGYSIQFAKEFTSKELVDDTHLSMVSFSNKTLDGKPQMFSVDVRKLTLNEAVKYAKWTIEGHLDATLKTESSITQNNTQGVRLEYIFDLKEGNKALTFIVINNKSYSYILNFNPGDASFMDPILSTFKLN